MKVQLLLISLLSIAGVALFFQGQQSSSLTLKAAEDSELYNTYLQWKTKFNKNYNESENEYRYAIFIENYNLIQKFNAEQSDVVLGLTEFAAMTNEEYKSSRISTHKKQKVQISKAQKPLQNTSVPSSVDWVQAGAVSSVMNQGFCSASWAISAAGASEGARFIEQGLLQKLSSQQILSCTNPGLGYGCDGIGYSTEGIKYANKTGLSTDAQYPYVQEFNPMTAPCQQSKINPVYSPGVSTQVASSNVTAMKQAVAKQPIVALVDASSMIFQLYSSGIIQSSSCFQGFPDQQVLIVGYNNSENAWTIKNSFGTSWGMNGYAKILISSGQGICGINMEVFHPKLKI